MRTQGAAIVDCVCDPQLHTSSTSAVCLTPSTAKSSSKAHPPASRGTHPRPAWGGPTLGQHTMWALEQLLGYDDDVITELVVTDILR